MKRWKHRFCFAVAAACLLGPSRLWAYVEAPYTLGRLIQESTNIMILKVEKVDREKNLIVYSKVKDLKGTHPTNEVKHNIAKAGFHPREWQYCMEAAQPGAIAIFMHNGSASECYIGNYWYQAYPGEWWAMSHGEPFLLRSYAGKPEKLAVAVTQILAGQEVVVPAMVDDKNALHTKSAKIQRLKSSLKLQDYNPKRDFVGWGNEDFRSLAGMPAFSQYTGIARTDPEAGGIATADFDGDGKLDVCVYGAGRVALLKNAGNSLEEAPLPYTGGARAAAWSDWNGDKKPDLILATPTGPVLLTNNGDGTFKDESARLPREPYYALTSAAWIDQDGDGRPDVLLANGFLGLRLYRNLGPGDGKAPAFENVSEKVGLGVGGLASGMKGSSLQIADLDGDGKQDVLYSAAGGLLLKNTGAAFALASEAQVPFKASRVAPLLADFDNDGKADITFLDEGKVRLFKNAGGWKFTDVTGQRGALAAAVENPACIAWTDFFNSGRKDLFIGVMKGPNRLLKSQPDGSFVDASDEVGLTQKVFNTRAASIVDLNNDKAPDLVLNNEGQESSVLLGDVKRFAGK